MKNFKNNENHLSKVECVNVDPITALDVESKMIVLRGQPVLIDADVAELYGVKTKEINQAVRNNPRKFPYDYLFELDKYEQMELVKNFDHLNKLKYSALPPTAFTERGLYMLATILKGDQAVVTTLAIIDTFARVRELKRELVSLHNEKDKDKQKSKIQHFGEVLTDIVMPDLQTTETESTIEINFVIGKINHTVKRVRREENAK